MSFDTLIRGGMLMTPDGASPGQLGLSGGRIAAILAPDDAVEAGEVIDATGLQVLPGLIDIHCHIRSPAYPNRGSVESETSACAAGGITTVFEMPITDPCCNTPDEVLRRREHFTPRAHVDFGLYAAPLTLTEAAVDALADTGIIGFKIFTTPAPPGREREFAGLAWPDPADQMEALRLIARTGLPVVVHAENAAMLARAERQVAGGDPADARIHNRARPPMAEAVAVAMLLTMNMRAQARLHIAHVTSAATVEVLRRFAGTSDFTAETCPHYLLFTETDVARVGVAAKINPPIRHAADREALWQAIADGVLTHVTTDHAAFAPPEKAAHAGNFLTAPPGHPGLETLLPAMLDAVHADKISLQRAVSVLSTNAAARFGLPDRGRLSKGSKADVILVDPSATTLISSTTLLTAARNLAALTEGAVFHGALRRTLLAGETIWHDGLTGTPGQGRFITPKGQA
jgi:dihydroorotase (multifunctional complex type)